MSNKPDFLKECMDGFGNVPLDSFNASFCAVCHNRDCSRSNASTMLFDQRVAGWKEKLFDNVPTADLNDPRFDGIRNKSFESVEPRPARAPAFFSTSPAQKTIKEEPPPVPEASTTLAQAKVESTPVKPKRAPLPDAANTSFQQGAMIGDAPAPKPAQEVEVVLAPGQSFTFDDE